ncbi:MAG: universal stress protein [Herminiimonas sp.]|nr:universal stress protein [Herminiimonas sp.]
MHSSQRTKLILNGRVSQAACPVQRNRRASIIVLSHNPHDGELYQVRTRFAGSLPDADCAVKITAGRGNCYDLLRYIASPAQLDKHSRFAYPELFMGRSMAMAYKTILVQVNDSRHLGPRVDVAAAIAATENARLIAAGLSGVTKIIYDTLTVTADVPGFASRLEVLRERADSALKQAENIAAMAGVKVVEKRLIDGEAGQAISLQGRYCDLVVLGTPDPDEEAEIVNSDFPEYVALHCGAPVLLIPFAGINTQVCERILIAWNASREAGRAVRNAIPLLRRAKMVEAVIFNPEAKPEEVYGMPPGSDLKIYLARHQIDVDIIIRSADGSVGDALLSLAKSTGVTLLVMGCYGHTRFRELILGGATRAVLKSTAVPLLMSH